MNQELYLVFLLFFLASAAVIIFAMIGYPVIIKLLDKFIKPSKHQKDFSYRPFVTLMIVAHNEEKVIQKKIENALSLDYPVDKLEIIIASDHSTDNTNAIVEKNIQSYPEREIRLFCSSERKGKTNAQNEAQKTVNSEILVMTDANAILKENAISELVSMFIEPDIAYVCGRLVYINSDDSKISLLESTYWDLDLTIRDIESRMKTITAGNGALYACRNNEYIDFMPIECHDSAMPVYYALHQKRALFNADAIAYEKAGENISDEWKRKVRMARMLLHGIVPSFKVFNFVKYGWFSFFYFGHRTCRYSLGLAHIIFFISSLGLVYEGGFFFLLILLTQILLFVCAIFCLRVTYSLKLLNMLCYYLLTICAQIVGVYQIVTGKVRSFWEKAETTR